MSNHTTGPPSVLPLEFNFCNLDGILRNHSSVVKTATLPIYIIVAMMSPLAVAGNTLILAVIWRNSSLRTPWYILLYGLVVTDLCMGLITQPFYVAVYTMCLEKPFQDFTWRSRWLIFSEHCYNHHYRLWELPRVCFSVDYHTMSIERWLHMARRSLVTGHRAGFLVAILLLLPIPMAFVIFLDAKN